jgi:hypothetical protein
MLALGTLAFVWLLGTEESSGQPDSNICSATLGAIGSTRQPPSKVSSSEPAHRSLPRQIHKDSGDLCSLFASLSELARTVLSSSSDEDRHLGQYYLSPRVNPIDRTTPPRWHFRWSGESYEAIRRDQIFQGAVDAGIPPVQIQRVDHLGSGSLRGAVRVVRRDGSEVAMQVTRPTSLAQRRPYFTAEHYIQELGKGSFESLLKDGTEEQFVKFFESIGDQISLDDVTRIVSRKNMNALKAFQRVASAKLKDEMFDRILELPFGPFWEEGFVELCRHSDWKQKITFEQLKGEIVIRIAPVLLKKWGADFKTHGAQVKTEDLVYLRDLLLNVFISNHYQSDQAYHLLLELQAFPIHTLSPQVLSHAQAIAAIHLTSARIVPSWIGNMMVQDIGFLDPPQASEGSDNLIEIRRISPDAPVFGFSTVEISKPNSNVWKRSAYMLNTSHNNQHGVVFQSGEGKTKRIWEKLAVGVGSTTSYYRDVGTGRVIMICVDKLENEKARIDEWTSSLKRKIDAAISQVKEKADVISIVDAAIPDVPLEIRPVIVSALQEEYPNRASDYDWQELKENTRVSFWSDTLEQIATVKSLIESYYKAVPEDAKIDFPSDPKNQALGYRIATDRGAEFIRAWMKKVGIFSGDDQDVDIDAYIHTLTTTNVFNAWSSLPLDRAVLAVFREGIFDSADTARSHMEVLRKVSARMTVAAQTPTLTLQQATENYIAAIQALDRTLAK